VHFAMTKDSDSALVFVLSLSSCRGEIDRCGAMLFLELHPALDMYILSFTTRLTAMSIEYCSIRWCRVNRIERKCSVALKYKY
jgi:hypothetical protein